MKNHENQEKSWFSSISTMEATATSLCFHLQKVLMFWNVGDPYVPEHQDFLDDDEYPPQKSWWGSGWSSFWKFMKNHEKS